MIDPRGFRQACRGAALAGLALLATGILPLPTRAQATPARLAVDDGRLMLDQPGAGPVDLSGIAGAEITLQDGLVLRLEGARAETVASGRTVWLHRVSVADAARGWRPLCEPHADGTREVLFLRGRNSGDGSLTDDPAGVEMSCTAGAQAKCLRFGYRPWGREADGSPSLALYNACVRMVRADYGGRGEPTTENGRLIDVYDDLGLQRPDLLSGQHFEAGWGPQGAVCVAAPRVPGNITPAQIEQRYPQLRGQVGPVCTEAYARSRGAILFNRSGPIPRSGAQSGQRLGQDDIDRRPAPKASVSSSRPSSM